MNAVVIGVGNRFRRDDSVGLLVLDELQGRLPIRVGVIESDGEPAGIIDAWAAMELAVVIDAVRHGARPGTPLHTAVDVGREWAGLPGPRAGAGTHNLGVGAAVALGRALGRLPSRLVIAGVEPLDTGFGEGLSGPVASTVPIVVAAVLREVGGVVRSDG